MNIMGLVVLYDVLYLIHILLFNPTVIQSFVYARN